MRKKEVFQYIFALLLFGSNGIVANHISLSSYEIVFFRTLIGSLFLWGIFSLKRGRLHFFQQGRQGIFLLCSGVAMGAGWMFLYEAYRQIGVGIATAVYYGGPVIVMAVSPFLFREKLTLRKVVSFGVVLLGIFLINGRALARGQSAWGLFCAAMAAVLYAGMVIFNKKALRIKGVENSMLQLFAGFITVAVFVGLKQGIALSVPQGEWGWVLLLGLVNTGIGCSLYFSAIGILPVQTVALLGYLEPLSAIVLSMLLLGERLLPLQLLGAVFILGGAAFGEGVGKKRKRKQLEEYL